MRHREEGILESQKKLDLTDAVTRLSQYAQEGFVFHGSPMGDITKLEPKPATDKDKSNTYNNDTAIFATDLPQAAVIFAVMSPVNIPDKIKKGKAWGIRTSGSDTTVTANIPASWKPFIENNIGFVYVCSEDGFDGQVGWQRKSNREVTPIEAVEVCFTDFESLGGVIVWKS